MIARVLTAVVLTALVGCSGYNPTGPAAGGGSSTNGGYGGGSTGAGSTGGGSTGGSPGGATGGSGVGTPAPISAAVVVGNLFFRSGHNGTANPAVDTVAAGGTVTWTWRSTGSEPHSVESVGAPSFTSSDIKSVDGSTYQVTFATPGKYQYQCAVHGSAMSGTIVVR
jgi:plastocyanin